VDPNNRTITAKLDMLVEQANSYNLSQYYS